MFVETTVWWKSLRGKMWLSDCFMRFYFSGESEHMSLITSEREHRAEKNNDYTKIPDKSVPLPFTAKHWKKSGTLCF